MSQFVWHSDTFGRVENNELIYVEAAKWISIQQRMLIGLGQTEDNQSTM